MNVPSMISQWLMIATEWIRRRYWLWQDWRRKRNPELVELDAYRILKRVDRMLKEWPHAIPLLEAGLKAAKITGQEDKWYSYAVRLRDYTPPTKDGESKGSDPQTPPRDVGEFHEKKALTDKPNCRS